MFSLLVSYRDFDSSVFSERKADQLMLTIAINLASIITFLAGLLSITFS